MPHPSQHEAFVRRIADEAEDPWEALLASEYAECDACGEALERLQTDGVTELAGKVEAVARDERESLRARGTFGPEREKELVARALAPLVAAAQSESPRSAPSPSASPPPSLARRHLLLMSGLAAAAVGVVWIATRPEEQPDPRLGPAGLRVLAPLGAVAQWGEFRWDARVPTGGGFAVEVLDEHGALIGGVERIEATSWRPPPEQSASWPARIRVRVRVLGAANERIDAAEIEAWLSER